MLMNTRKNAREEAIESIQELFASLIDNQDFIPQPLRSVHAQKNALKQQCRDGIDLQLKRLYNGISLLAKDGLIQSRDDFVARLTPFIEQNSLDHVQQESTLQDRFEISNDAMLDFYQRASELYHAGHLSDAADLFFLLTVLNPLISSFWLGLGITEQCQEQHEPALLAYWMALQTDEEDLQPLLRSSECLRALKYHKQADDMLDLYNRRKS